jgi:hypothetical protein
VTGGLPHSAVGVAPPTGKAQSPRDLVVKARA